MLHPNLSPSETPLQQLSACPRQSPWVSSSPILKLLWVTTSSKTHQFPNLSPLRLRPLRSRSLRRKLKLRSPQPQRSIGLCPRPVRWPALRSPAARRQARRLPVFPLSHTARRLQSPDRPGYLHLFLPRPPQPRPLPFRKTPA